MRLQERLYFHPNAVNALWLMRNCQTRYTGKTVVKQDTTGNQAIKNATTQIIGVPFMETLEQDLY